MTIFELRLRISITKKLPSSVPDVTNRIPDWIKPAFRFGSAALVALAAHVALRDPRAPNLFIEELIKALMR